MVLNFYFSVTKKKKKKNLKLDNFNCSHFRLVAYILPPSRHFTIHLNYLIFSECYLNYFTGEKNKKEHEN